jgi:hypothetical protein
MSANAMEFKGFTAACENATVTICRPYGIYHNGETFWDDELIRQRGCAIRFFEDPSQPMHSLVVLDLDGNFLCSAWPVAWHERDHPIFRELEAA